MEPDRFAEHLAEITVKLIEHPHFGTAADRAMVLHLMMAAAGMSEDLAARLLASTPADQAADVNSYMAMGWDWDGDTIAETLRRLEV